MKWLKELRKGKKLEQQQAADLAGIHKQTLVNIEAGKSSPEWITVMKLLKGYGYSVYIVNEITGKVLTSEGTQDVNSDVILSKIKSK